MPEYEVYLHHSPSHYVMQVIPSVDLNLLLERGKELCPQFDRKYRGPETAGWPLGYLVAQNIERTVLGYPKDIFTDPANNILEAETVEQYAERFADSIGGKLLGSIEELKPEFLDTQNSMPMHLTRDGEILSRKVSRKAIRMNPPKS